MSLNAQAGYENRVFESKQVSAEEEAELAELQEMLGHRSEVPRGLYLKFVVSRENRAKADKARQERAERDAERDRQRQEIDARGDELRLRRGEKDQEAVARSQHKKWEEANKIREAERKWEEERQQAHDALMTKVKNRGSADFHNDRLAELEAGYDQAKRDEATAARNAYLRRAAEQNAENMARKQATAGRLRTEVEGAHANAKGKLNDLKRTQSDSTLQAKREWQEEHARNERARLKLAQENKTRIENVRRQARANREKQTRKRMEAARLERENDIVAVTEKKKNLRNAQIVRGKVYGNRYVSKDEAEEMEQSSFRRLFGIPSSGSSPGKR